MYQQSTPMLHSNERGAQSPPSISTFFSPLTEHHQWNCGLALNYYFLVIQVVFLFFGFLQIKVIFHVCLRILSEFLENWVWSPRVLSVFTDFLSWLSWPSRIFIKKAPSGARKSIGASKSVFFDQKRLRFSNSFPKNEFYVIAFIPVSIPR